MRARRIVVGGLFAALLTGGVTSAVVSGSSVTSSSTSCYGPCAPHEGYWLAGSDGGVFTFGRATFHGSIPSKYPKLRLAKPIVGIASTGSGHGYWLVGGDGGVFSFGNAKFGGSLPGYLKKHHLTLRAPIVGMTAKGYGTRGGTNSGYWLVGADGGVFTGTGAKFYGSVPGLHINLREPAVGIASTPRGLGYWVVAKDGGIFRFGNAGFYGSLPQYEKKHHWKHLVHDIVGMAPTPNGQGYWLVGADGGVYTFGNAHFYGSLPYYSLFSGPAKMQSGAITGIAAAPDGGGYWLVLATGYVYAFGDAARLKELTVRPSHPIVGISALNPVAHQQP